MFFNDFIPALLKMSLTAGIAVIFVLLLRLLLKKTPKVISYALWAVVLFRLVCPISVESSLSLFGLFDSAIVEDNNVTIQAEYTPDTPTYDLQHDYTPSVEQQSPILPAEEATPVYPVESELEAMPTVPTNEEKSELSPYMIIGCIWLIGVVLMSVYAVVNYIKLRMKLITASPLRENIYLADDITSPFVMGLIKPRIYLPSNLSDREQPYIILHEQQHIKRLDHFIKFIAFAALCVHWFNPLVWIAFIMASKDMEMSCDEAVVKKMGDSVRADYAASLLSLATGRRIIAGMPLAFGEGDTKGRIRNLANWRRPAFWVIIIAVIACTVLAICLITNPVTEKLPFDLDDIVIDSANAVDLRSSSPKSFDLNNDELSKLKSRLSELRIKGSDDELSGMTLCYSITVNADEYEFSLQAFDLEGNNTALYYDGEYYRIEDERFKAYLSDTCARLENPRPAVEGMDYLLTYETVAPDGERIELLCDYSLEALSETDSVYILRFSLHQVVEYPESNYSIKNILASLKLPEDVLCRIAYCLDGETAIKPTIYYDGNKAEINCSGDKQIEAEITLTGDIGKTVDLNVTFDLIGKGLNFLSRDLDESVTFELKVGADNDGVEDTDEEPPVVSYESLDLSGEVVEVLVTRGKDSKLMNVEFTGINREAISIKDNKALIVDYYANQLYMYDSSANTVTPLLADKAYGFSYTDYEVLTGKYDIIVWLDVPTVNNGFDRIAYWSNKYAADGVMSLTPGIWIVELTDGSEYRLDLGELSPTVGDIGWADDETLIFSTYDDKFYRINTVSGVIEELSDIPTDRRPMIYINNTLYFEQDSKKTLPDNATLIGSVKKIINQSQQPNENFVSNSPSIEVGSEIYANEDMSEVYIADLGGYMVYVNGQLEYKNEAETLEKEIKAIIEASEKREFRGDNPEGTFLWPVAGYKEISSEYGIRWGIMHPGIDIAGEDIKNADISAADAGVVMYAYNGCTHNYGKSTSCGCGNGFGNYCMIDHGGGYVTVYGHAAEIHVSEGQYVSAGDIIGTVGSTGYSTGDHLHFEVRIDGEAIDPANLLNVIVENSEPTTMEAFGTEFLKELYGAFDLNKAYDFGKYTDIPLFEKYMNGLVEEHLLLLKLSGYPDLPEYTHEFKLLGSEQLEGCYRLCYEILRLYTNPDGSRMAEGNGAYLLIKDSGGSYEVVGYQNIISDPYFTAQNQGDSSFKISNPDYWKLADEQKVVDWFETRKQDNIEWYEQYKDNDSDVAAEATGHGIPDVSDRPYGKEVTIFKDNTFDCDYSDYEEIAYDFYELRRSVMAPKGWTGFRYYEEVTSFENRLTGIPIYDGPLPVKIDMFDYTTKHANDPMNKSTFFFAEYPWLDPYLLINSSLDENIKKYDHETYVDKKGRTMQVYFIDGLPKYAVYDDFFNLCIWFNLDTEKQIPIVVNMINSIEVTLSSDGEYALQQAEQLGYTVVSPENESSSDSQQNEQYDSETYKRITELTYLKNEGLQTVYSDSSYPWATGDVDFSATASEAYAEIVAHLEANPDDYKIFAGAYFQNGYLHIMMTDKTYSDEFSELLNSEYIIVHEAKFTYSELYQVSRIAKSMLSENGITSFAVEYRKNSIDVTAKNSQAKEELLSAIKKAGYSVDSVNIEITDVVIETPL